MINPDLINARSIYNKIKEWRKKPHFSLFFYICSCKLEKINERRMPGTCLQQLLFALQLFFPLSSLLLRKDH